MKPVNVHALSRRYHGIARVITTPVIVINPATQASETTEGIWDTGATNSTITKTLATKLGLIPVSRTMVTGVHGSKEVNLYAVTVRLNNQNVEFTLPVSECDQLSNDGSANMLIGMDVISKGDFSVSNYNGNTTMSFRFPSIQDIDFVAANKAHQPIVKHNTQGRNDKCNCQSGKKYKHCCGKQAA